MRLISLSLHNYRKFQDAEVEFPDGITGIIGLNGVGKSSLVEAIAWVLYGHDATRTKKEGIRRSQASRNADCRVGLRLELNGDFYEVSRALRGANLSTDAQITVNGKEWVRSPEKTTREIEKLLGMDRRSFFRSFYAKQKELSVLSGITPRDRKDVIIKMLRIDALDKAVEKMKEDRKEKLLVLETLRSQIPDKKSLKTETKEMEGRLRQLTERSKAQTKRVDELSLLLRQKKEELERLDELMDRNSNLRNRFVKLETELKNTYSAVAEVEAAIDSLANDEREYSRLKPQVEDLGHLRDEERRMSVLSKKFFERHNLLAQLEKERRKQGEIESELAEARARMESLEFSVEALKQTEEKFEKILVGIQTLRTKKSACENEVKTLREKVAELEGKKSEIAKLGKNAACPMCGRELGEDYPIILGHFEKESSEAGEKIRKGEGEIEGLEKRLSRGEEMKRLAEQQLRSLRNKRIEYEKTEERVKQLGLQNTGLVKSAEEIEGRLRDLGEVLYEEENHQRLKQIIEERGQVQERLATYRTRLDSRPQLKKKKEEGETKIGLLTEELGNTKSELHSVNYSREAHRQSKLAHESLSEKLEQERAVLHSIEIDLKSTLNQLESLRFRSEEISRRESEAARLEDTVATLNKLVEIFVDFRLQLIQKIRPRLAGLASVLFERMTEGKYRGMELSEDYELSLIEGANAYTIDRFSGGEADLANLALRLAISELIAEATGNELSFIILDEIFGSQDTIRKGLIMAALKELSRRFRQILLITHVEEVKDSLENIIEVYENADGVSVVQQE